MFRFAHRLMTVAALAILGIAPAPAWGWGKEGHIIVAKIAELRLTPQARAAINELIDLSIADDHIANWPDHIRDMPSFQKIFAHNNLWHFVDIPYEAKTYDPEREAKGVADRLGLPVAQVGTSNNVVEQIEAWKKVLADKSANPLRRRDALRFLVHFLGDIHQPLHCATHEDSGGNAVKVVFLNQHDPHLNLHSAWDNNLVHVILGDRDPLDYAHLSSQAITPQEQTTWEALAAPKDWAEESHALAVKVAYPALPQLARGHVLLDANYVAAARPHVEEQLKKAGVRLAKVLNEALQ